MAHGQYLISSSWYEHLYPNSPTLLYRKQVQVLGNRHLRSCNLPSDFKLLLLEGYTLLENVKALHRIKFQLISEIRNEPTLSM